MANRENLFRVEEFNQSDLIPERESSAGLNDRKPKPRPRTILTTASSSKSGIEIENNDSFSIEDYKISSSGDHDHDFKNVPRRENQRLPAFEVPSRISSSNTGESSQRKRNPFTLTASADVHHSPYSLQEHNSENFKEQEYHIEDETKISTPKPLRPRTKLPLSPLNNPKINTQVQIHTEPNNVEQSNDESEEENQSLSNSAESVTSSEEISVKKGEIRQNEDYLVIPMPADETTTAGESKDEEDQVVHEVASGSGTSFLGKWKKAIKTLSKESSIKSRSSSRKNEKSIATTEDEGEIRARVKDKNKEPHIGTPDKSSRRRRQSMSSQNSTPSPSHSMHQQQKSRPRPEIYEANKVLGICLHNSDLLPADSNIVHPVVKVTIMDQDGSYIQKGKFYNQTSSERNDSEESNDQDGRKKRRRRRKRRGLSSKNENGSRLTSQMILPMMTQPYELLSPSFQPTWNELIVFDEVFKKFVHENSNCIFFFEIMDFLPMSRIKSSSKHYYGSENGWYKIAWAFLKPVSPTGARNINKKLRLQLYKPERLSSKEITDGPEVFWWWKIGKRIKINSTLYVTVKGITPPSCPATNLQTLLKMKKEELTEALIDSQLNEQEGAEDEQKKQKKSVSSESMVILPQWSRLQGQSCKPPNKIHQLLPSSDFDSLKINISGNVQCVKFSPDGLKLAAGFSSAQLHTILVFEIPSGKLIKSLRCHHGLIYDLCWTNIKARHRDENILYLGSASADSTASIWSFHQDGSVKLVKTLLHPTYVYCIKFHPTQTNVAVTGCFDHIIRIWSISQSSPSRKSFGLNDCTPLAMLDRHSSFVNCLEFHSNGKYFFSGDGEGFVYKWKNMGNSRRNWEVEKKTKVVENSKSPINSISIDSVNGNRLLVHSRQSCLKIVDVETFLVLHTFLGCTNDRYNVRSCFSACGNLILSGSEDGTLCIWDADTTRILQFITPESHSNDCIVTSVDYHPYDYFVAIGICSSKSINGEAYPVLIYTYFQQQAVLQLPTMVKMKKLAKGIKDKFKRDKAGSEDLDTVPYNLYGAGDHIGSETLKNEIVQPVLSDRLSSPVPPQESVDSTDKFMSILWKLDNALKVTRQLTKTEPNTTVVSSNDSKQIVTGKPPLPPKPRNVNRKKESSSAKPIRNDRIKVGHNSNWSPEKPNLTKSSPTKHEKSRIRRKSSSSLNNDESSDVIE